MKSQKQSRLLLSKKMRSLNQKSQQLQNRSSLQMSKQNDLPEISPLNKYFNQNRIQHYRPDQTDKYLQQTKTKLYSSSQKLRQFHQKRQKFKFIDETFSFAILGKEIKSSRKNLLTRHLVRSQKSDKTSSTNNQSKSTLNLYNFSTNFINESTSRTSPSKISTTTSDHFGINKKFTLIEKLLSEQESRQFKTELFKKIKQLENQYSGDELMKRNIIRYYINHQIMQRFLEESAKDTRKITLRKQNIRLYHKIRDQMVSVLSNEEHFLKHIQEISKQEEQRSGSLLRRTPANESRLLKITGKSKLSPNGEKAIFDKIEDLLQISKNSIKQAFINFGQVSKSNEIQVQFNKKLNNNFFMQRGSFPNQKC